MRLFFYVAATSLLLACDRVEIPEEIDNGQPMEREYDVKRFTFTVKGDFQNPTFTRANSAMTADGVEMTDLWVVDVVKPSEESEGTVVQSLHQVNTDADWGAPTMSLTLGTHHVLFLASRGQNPTYNNGVVTWTKPLDTFYTDYAVTVVKTSNGNRAVTLNRIATKLNLVVEDAIPEGTTGFVITPTVWYNGWNMLTGEPVAAQDYTNSVAVPATWWGVTGGSVAAWSLSGQEEWLTNVTFASMNGETTNAEVTIEDVPLRANRSTVYRGCLYSKSSESNVSINATWLPQYEGVY